MHKLTVPMTFLLTATLALAGCAGDDEGDGNGGTTTTTSTSATSTQTTTTTTTTSPMEEQAPKYLNGTITDLVSCTIVAAAVAAGVPLEPVSMSSTESLAPEDVNRTYEITLTADAPSSNGGPQFPLAALCVGFNGDYTFAEGNTGTIPEGATEMIIGGDFAFQGEYSIKID